MADINAVETPNAMKEKHPPMHPNSRFPPLVEGTASTQISISEDVCHAIRSLFQGVQQVGQMGSVLSTCLISPVLLQRGVVGNCSVHSHPFATSLLVVLHLRLLSPIFFGATLIPLRKKDGGVRTIAVGQTLRRLVANRDRDRETRTGPGP